MDQDIINMIDEICLLKHQDLVAGDLAFISGLYRQDDKVLTERQTMRVFLMYVEYVKGKKRPDLGIEKRHSKVGEAL